MDWPEFLTQQADLFLNKLQKQAFLKRLGEEKNEEETAQELGIVPETLKKRMKGVYKTFAPIYPEIAIAPNKKCEKLRACLLKDYHLRALNFSHTPQPNVSDSLDNIDAIVRDIRQQIRDKIHHLCGTIRVLDMTQPIELEKIFTRVNILKNIRSREHRALRDLLTDFTSPDSDRFINLPGERIPGLKVVDELDRLIILGRPGSGKTTFLQSLAMQSIEDKCIDSQCLDLQINREISCLDEQCQEKQNLKQLVPIFISLKDFAEAPNEPDLLAYIRSEIENDISNDINLIFKGGRGLILLDGLDEIRKSQRISVNQRIENFVNANYKNKFVITCRSAVIGYKFSQFTEVEIADLESEQIETFVRGWFASRKDGIKGERFLQKLTKESNKPIQELATNPLLLTLLCLVFEGYYHFPRNRSELYEEGLEVLLGKWDAKRNIERNEGYETLSLKNKKNLLSQIAYATWLKGSYVFEQKIVENEINKYFQNLPNASEDLATNEEAILKSIESDHGLLVEQAKKLYSFSHLTFHEYFTAKYIVDNCDPNSAESPIWQELMSHLTDPAYREIFLLTVEMLYTANAFVELIKNKIDSLLAEDRTLQEFLQWVERKSQFLLSQVGCNYHLAAIRANYLDFDIAIDCDRQLGSLLDRKLTLIFTCASLIGRAGRCGIERTFKYVTKKINLEETQDLDRAMAMLLVRTRAINILLDRGKLDPEFWQRLDQVKSQLEAVNKIQENLKSLPACSNEAANLRRAYKQAVQAWGDLLRRAIVPYYSQGENWRYQSINAREESENLSIHEFSNEQEKLLEQYYYANLLLASCLQSDIRLAPKVKQTIEENLILPTLRG